MAGKMEEKQALIGTDEGERALLRAPDGTILCATPHLQYIDSGIQTITEFGAVEAGPLLIGMSERAAALKCASKFCAWQVCRCLCVLVLFFAP